MTRTILVVGASGVTGRYFLDHAIRRGDRTVIGMARNRPDDFPEAGHFVAADAMDPDAVEQALDGLPTVTDVVYAGFVNAPSFLEQVAPNRRLLAGTLGGVTRASDRLERIVLIQGMKYYGSHLGPFRSPARENDPRHMPPNYYYEQQDFLAEAQAAQKGTGAQWSWTCLRPHVICGHSLRSPQNILAIVGVYAAISRELGLPLRFPGTPAAFDAINQATDAGLLARGIDWALETPEASNEAYNITNGDFFRWRHLWTRIAELFGMETAEPQTISLGDFMADKGDVWDRVVRRHGLSAPAMDAFVHWPFADYIWRVGWDVMASTVKIRQAGFADCLDTEDMYIDHLRSLQDQGFLPGKDARAPIGKGPKL